jgi:hypothetical protein
VAALAGGGALTFEPDLEEDELLPGARPAADAATPEPVSEATPDEIEAELARERAEAQETVAG